MKRFHNFFDENGWFTGNVDAGGPVQMAYKKGKLDPKPLHYHENAYEYFIVLNGRCTIEIEGERQLLEKGAVVIVEPGEKHEITECSDDLEMLLLMDLYYEKDTKNV